MNSLLQQTVADVRFTPAAEALQRTGLLGWTQFTVGGLVIDGVAVRKPDSGPLSLSFPEKTGANGRRWPIVRPRSNDSRREIERQVFAALFPKERGCVEVER